MTIVVGTAMPGFEIREFTFPVVREIVVKPQPSGGSAW